MLKRRYKIGDRYDPTTLYLHKLAFTGRITAGINILGGIYPDLHSDWAIPMTRCIGSISLAPP